MLTGIEVSMPLLVYLQFSKSKGEIFQEEKPKKKKKTKLKLLLQEVLISDFQSARFAANIITGEKKQTQWTLTWIKYQKDR